MKLFQSSLLHTGYIILKDGSIEAAFSSNVVKEAMNKFPQGQVEYVFGTNEDKIPELCKQIKEYKAKYNILPRYLMDELRTGFSNSRFLHQSKQNYFK